MFATVEMSPGARLLRLESAIAGFTDVLRVGSLDARILACPGWDLRDLSWHLGAVHRWATRCLTEGPVPFPDSPGPSPRGELVTWFREGARTLLGTLRRSDPTTACWTFDPHDATVGFWGRRQMHETVMHLWDAQRSQGHPDPVGPPVAADGVAEALEMFLPRQIRLGRLAGLPGRMLIELSDVGPARWLLGPDGVERIDPQAGPGPLPAGARALVRGPAQTVLLALWHRTPPHDAHLEYIGDRPLAQNVLASALAP